MTCERHGSRCRHGDRDAVLTARWTWRPEARLVREARHRAETTIGAWGVAGEDLEDVILILSELISNAAAHGKGSIDVTLRLDRFEGTLTGGIRDAGPGWPCVRTGAETGEVFAEHGRGLHLVGLLSTRWGVTREADGVHKTVWFCRALP